MEGHLVIQLVTDEDGVSDVRVRSSRPVHASVVFQGKTVDEVQRMIPLLYSVCATAQACAAVRALEQAMMGCDASEETNRQRDCLVNMETLREHLWRILLDWPLSTGDLANNACMADVLGVQGEYRLAFGLEAELFSLHRDAERLEQERLVGLQDRLLELLHHHVFDMPLDSWSEIASYEQLIEWSTGGHSASARLMNRIVNEGWSDSGACDSMPLPKLSPAQLEQEMQDGAFIEKPQWHGHCCETTSLTRVRSPLLDDLQARFANGLLVRLVARLQEVATLTGRMVPDSSGAHVRPAGKAAGKAAEPANGPAIGIGQVAAARGQLVHRVVLTHGRVSDYRILAPTEWNFHPNGVLASALATLRGGAQQIEAQARLLINAIDPCVGYDLVVAKR